MKIELKSELRDEIFEALSNKTESKRSLAKHLGVHHSVITRAFEAELASRFPQPAPEQTPVVEAPEPEVEAEPLAEEPARPGRKRSLSEKKGQLALKLYTDPRKPQSAAVIAERLNSTIPTVLAELRRRGAEIRPRGRQPGYLIAARRKGMKVA